MCGEVVSKCCEFILRRMDTTNCVGFWQFSRIYQIGPELESPVALYMKENIQSIPKHEEFLEMPVEDMVVIMQWNWQTRNELESVFTGLLDWISCSSATEERRLLIPQLMKDN